MLYCKHQGYISTAYHTASVGFGMYQVRLSPVLVRVEPHPPDQALLGQMLAVGRGRSTLPRPPRPQGDPGQQAEPLPLGARGASPSLEGQALNWPLAMALHKVRQCWTSLRH